MSKNSKTSIFLSDNNHFVTGDFDGKITLWKDHKIVESKELSIGHFSEYAPHKALVKYENGEILAVAAGGRMEVFDNNLKHLHYYEKIVRDPMALTSSATHYAVGDSYGHVILILRNGGKVVMVCTKYFPDLNSFLIDNIFVV